MFNKHCVQYALQLTCMCFIYSFSHNLQLLFKKEGPAHLKRIYAIRCVISRNILPLGIQVAISGTAVVTEQPQQQ